MTMRRAIPLLLGSLLSASVFGATLPLPPESVHADTESGTNMPREMMSGAGCDRRDLSAGALRAAEKLMASLGTSRSRQHFSDFRRAVEESVDGVREIDGYGFLWRKILLGVTESACLRQQGVFRDAYETMSGLIALQLQAGASSVTAMDLRIELLGWMKSRIMALEPEKTLAKGWRTEEERLRYARWANAYAEWYGLYAMAVRMLERSLVESHPACFEWKTDSERCLYQRKLESFLGRRLCTKEELRVKRKAEIQYVEKIYATVHDGKWSGRVLWP